MERRRRQRGAEALRHLAAQGQLSTLAAGTRACCMQGAAEGRVGGAGAARGAAWAARPHRLKLALSPRLAQFPDWDRAPLVQALVNALWPGVNEYLRRRAASRRQCSSACAPAVHSASRRRRRCRRAPCRLISDKLKGAFGEAGAFGVPSIEQFSFGAKPPSVLGVRCLPAADPADPQRVESLVVLLELRWAGRPEVSLRVAGGSVQVGAAAEAGQGARAGSAACLEWKTGWAAYLLPRLRSTLTACCIALVHRRLCRRCRTSRQAVHCASSCAACRRRWVAASQLSRSCLACSLRRGCVHWAQAVCRLADAAGRRCSPQTGITCFPVPMHTTQLPFIGALCFNFLDCPRPRVAFDLK